VYFNIPVCKIFFPDIVCRIMPIRIKKPRPAAVPGLSPALPAALHPVAAEAVGRHLGVRLRQLRAARGWSLESMSGASGVSRSMLSEIEREQANPTLAVTLRIAQAFGMSLGELIGSPAASAAVTVIRKNDRAFHYRSEGNCRIRTLSPLHLEKDVEFYEVALARGGALRSAAHFAGTREFITVVKGQLTVDSAGEQDQLHPGDSATYRADVPHALINAGRHGALVFLVVIYP
jgi:transcriptional regulator with XRE-family HTH domain